MSGKGLTSVYIRLAMIGLQALLPLLKDAAAKSKSPSDDVIIAMVEELIKMLSGDEIINIISRENKK